MISDHYISAYSSVGEKELNDLVNFTNKHGVTISRISKVPEQWTNIWYDMHGKDFVDKFLASLGKIGGTYFHYRFSAVSLSQNKESRKKNAIALSMDLSEAYEIMTSLSESNRPHSYLLYLSGISLETLIEWDKYDLATAIAPRSRWDESKVADFLKNGIDRNILGALNEET